MTKPLGIAATMVVVFTVVVTATTDLSFWVPLGVLSFNWIAAPLIGEWIERRNPALVANESARNERTFHWRVFAGWLVVFAGIAVFVRWRSDLGFGAAFSYTLLFGTTALALSGIVIGVEDNRKGGWLDP